MLATIEAKWNLPALTSRDANAATVADFLAPGPPTCSTAGNRAAAGAGVGWRWTPKINLTDKLRQLDTPYAGIVGYLNDYKLVVVKVHRRVRLAPPTRNIKDSSSRPRRTADNRAARPAM